MRLLVISDYFHSLIPRDSITYIKWNEDKEFSLVSPDCVLVDMTFENENEKLNKTKLLYHLMEKLKKATLINKGLALIVICGSPIEELELDVPYDKRAPRDNLQPIEFNSFDFLQNILPDYLKSVHFEVNTKIYSVAPIPINLYVDRYHSERSFLYYDYESGNKKHADIRPLAGIKERGGPYAAFECRNGKGVVVVLTPYGKEEAEQAFMLLLRICKHYTGDSEVVEEIKKVDYSIPEPVRSTFIEALVCFGYDLYVPALISCRKALEESAIEQGATKRNLKDKIREIFENDKDSILKRLAHQIKDFGNWVVHPEIYAGKEATEDDAKIVINCLKNYFNYIYSIPQIAQTTEERTKELKERRLNKWQVIFTMKRAISRKVFYLTRQSHGLKALSSPRDLKRGGNGIRN